MSDRQPLIKDTSPVYGAAAGAPPPVPPGAVQTQGPDPTLPPIGLVDAVTGYEQATFQSGGLIAPPTYSEAISTPLVPSAPPPPPATHVNEGQARQSLLQLAGQNCCWGKKAAEDMSVNSITSSSAFHYQLNTFTEARKSAWTHEPYYGDPIDGPFNGPAPPPWNIPMQPDSMFRNHEKHCEVPHTACVKPCHDCTGTGSRRCHQCHGRGRAHCSWCHGSGYQTHVHVVGNHGHDHGHHHHHHHHHHHQHAHTDMTLCHQCAGTGHKVCWVCSGCGNVACRTCNSKGQLKCYIKLSVIWHTHTSDHIVESTALPDNLVRNAGGQVAFEESAIRVAPVGHFPNNQINSASQSLVQQHSTAFPSEKILMQRHKVRVIPVSEVQSDYKGTHFTYWVYGNDNVAFAPDYPQQCCCGCTIL